MFQIYLHKAMSLRHLPPTRRNRYRPHHEQHEAWTLFKSLATTLALVLAIYVILALASYIWRHPDVSFVKLPQLWQEILTFER